MQLHNRIKKIEGQITTTNGRPRSPLEELEYQLHNHGGTPEEGLAILSDLVWLKQNLCEHPASLFHIRKCYPYPRIPDYKYKLVIKGHCDSCGYDGPLWDIANTTEEQLDRMAVATEHTGRYENEYTQELVREGYLDYTPWPPSDAVMKELNEGAAWI